MNRLIILDFVTGNVDIYPINYMEVKDYNELLSNLGHDPNNCQWMISSGTIILHNSL